MWMRCARPGTLGATPSPFAPLTRNVRPIRRPQNDPAKAAADEAGAKQAAEEAKQAAEEAAAAARAAVEAAQAAGEVPPSEEETKSTWGETMATVVGAAAPTILAGVVLYYLTREPTGNPIPTGDYVLFTDCTQWCSGDDISEMQDSAEEISRRTFLRWVDRNSFRALEESLGYSRKLPMSADREVAYFKSTFRGIPCVFLVWSRIEFVFIAPEHVAHI